MPTRGELPANTAQWTLHPQRAMVLIHDMQRYFVDAFPSGREPVTDLLRNTVALRNRCAELSIPVSYTAQPGSMTPDERGLLRDFWGSGMTASHEQRAIVNELAPAVGDAVFVKWRYSAFHRSSLLEHLREHGRDQLVICGVYAHVGCLMTACDAFTNDIQPFLVADAVGDFSPKHHRWALEYAAERCAVVLPTLAVIDALTRDRVGS